MGRVKIVIHGEVYLSVEPHEKGVNPCFAKHCASQRNAFFFLCVTIKKLFMYTYIHAMAKSWVMTKMLLTRRAAVPSAMSLARCFIKKCEALFDKTTSATGEWNTFFQLDLGLVFVPMIKGESTTLAIVVFSDLACNPVTNSLVTMARSLNADILFVDYLGVCKTRSGIEPVPSEFANRGEVVVSLIQNLSYSHTVVVTTGVGLFAALRFAAHFEGNVRLVLTPFNLFERLSECIMEGSGFLTRVLDSIYDMDKHGGLMESIRRLQCSSLGVHKLKMFIFDRGTQNLEQSRQVASLFILFKAAGFCIFRSFWLTYDSPHSYEEESCAFGDPLSELLLNKDFLLKLENKSKPCSLPASSNDTSTVTIISQE